MKLSKEEMARREGMAYALKIAKEGGVEALEAELKRRNALYAPCTLSKKELDEFVNNVKTHTIGVVASLAVYVLRNKFDWGNQAKNGNRGRLDEFKYWMNYFADSVITGYLTVDDIVEDLVVDGKVDMFFQKNDKDVKLGEKEPGKKC